MGGPVLAREPRRSLPQVAPAGVDPTVELGADRSGAATVPPTARDGGPAEKLAGDPPNRSETGQGCPRARRVTGPVLSRDPVVDEVETKAGRSRSARPPARRRDLRHEIAPAEPGGDPSAGAVGPAGEGARPFTGGVGDRHVPALELGRVVDETGAVHRPDHRPGPVSEAGDVAGETGQPVGVGWRGVDGESLARLVPDVDVEAAS